MKLFNVEFGRDLLEIIKRLEQEKNIDLRNSLLKDKKTILRYLGLTVPSERLNNRNTNNDNINHQELIDFINNNQLRNLGLKKIRLNNINYEKLSLLTKIFIEKSSSKLSNIYKKITSYGGIKYFKEDPGFLGCTRYFKSLDKNYIEIFKENLLSDHSTKVHELAHARVNSICNDMPNKFFEVYPYFMELLFSDFLKKDGLINESYNIKISILLQLKNNLRELSYELRDYLNSYKGKTLDKFIFEYKYNSSKDIILAFYLYECYLLKPKETQIKIDYFLLNLNQLSEDSLLRILNLDKSIFNNIRQPFYKIYDNLEKERTKLLKNHKQN